MREASSIDVKALTEREVQSLRGEVTDDVGRVTTPQRYKTLVTVSASKTITDTLVWVRQTSLLDLCRVLESMTYT